jgi:6,7-dimethyl-8-ribityllumazine synthase
VVNAVLSFDNENQAQARCLENKINRGTEAARAAVEIANVLSEVRSNQGAAVSKLPGDNG